MSFVTLTGGKFRDLEGSPLSNGTLALTLSHDEQDSSDSSQVVGGLSRSIPLDMNGNIAGSPQVEATDTLNPSGAFYTVMAYRQDMVQAWRAPQYWVISSTPSPLDVGTLIPYNPPGQPITASNLALNYDIVCYVPGTLTSGQVLLPYNVIRTLVMSQNLTGAVSTSQVAATSSATINIKQNSTTIGSINFASSASTATFTFASNITLSPGNALNFVSASADSTLAGVSFTIPTVRVV